MQVQVVPLAVEVGIAVLVAVGTVEVEIVVEAVGTAVAVAGKQGQLAVGTAAVQVFWEAGDVWGRHWGYRRKSC